MTDIHIVPTPELGDRSYVVDDGSTAVVVDPQRDLDRILAVVEDRNLRVTHVLETHMHNDYVSGGLALVRHLGADYLVPADDPVRYPRVAVRDGDVIRAGTLTITVLATPGHTEHHVSYLVSDEAGRHLLFSGGSLLYGATGRTDLISPELTERLTRLQYRSVRRLAEQLPPETEIYPTHGFGSFCAATPATVVDRSTLAAERLGNPALTIPDEERFVTTILAGLTPYPRYYAHMGPLNLAGAFPPDLSPAQAIDADELRRRLAAREWVIDLRDRRPFAAEHLAGTYNMELGKDFASYLGWVVPWGVRLTVLAEREEQVAIAQRQLVRIGIDRVHGRFVADSAALREIAPVRSYPVADFDDLAAARRSGRDLLVLDVRHDHEWREGHLDGALHIPFEDLAEHVEELPRDREIWIHCATGHRASIAASMVDRAGRRPVLVDDRYARVVDAGHRIVREAA